MLKLDKPVIREMKGNINGKKFVVELDFPDIIKFRKKRSKVTYSVPLNKVFNLAVYQFLVDDYNEKMKMFRIKKSEGKNPKKPKKPNLDLFDSKMLKLFGK